MADRDEIIAFCDELLRARDFDDYGPNGLQVPGRQRVERVVTGVSAHLELIERAVAAGADLLVAHHGLFWDAQPRALSEQAAARLRLLLGSELSLAAYHLPLDADPEIGNNALLREGLGLKPIDGESGRFADARGEPIGVIGSSAPGIGPAELRDRIERLLGRAPLQLGAGPELIERVGLISGAGASYVHEAIASGLDALITGEPAEYVTADAREGGIHFFAAGHHATETLGIRRLGELVAERFGVEHEFIDVPNPV